MLDPGAGDNKASVRHDGLPRDASLPGAQALGRSLDKTGSSLPRVVMVTPNVPDAVASQLAACGWDPCPVAPIANPHPDGELLFPRFGLSFSKLRAFDLTEFERVVFLDADTLVLRNVDHLFDRPSPHRRPRLLHAGPLQLRRHGPRALAPAVHRDAGRPRPRAQLRRRRPGLLELVLARLVGAAEAHRLRSGYNLHHFIFQFLLAHPHLRQQCLNRVHIVHYTLQKPWLGRFMLTGGAQIWWDKFYAAHPKSRIPPGGAGCTSCRTGGYEAWCPLLSG